MRSKKGVVAKRDERNKPPGINPAYYGREVDGCLNSEREN